MIGVWAQNSQFGPPQLKWGIKKMLTSQSAPPLAQNYAAPWLPPLQHRASLSCHLCRAAPRLPPLQHSAALSCQPATTAAQHILWLPTLQCSPLAATPAAQPSAATPLQCSPWLPPYMYAAQPSAAIPSWCSPWLSHSANAAPSVATLLQQSFGCSQHSAALSSHSVAVQPSAATPSQCQPIGCQPL